MSVESRLPNSSEGRLLRAEEKALLSALLSQRSDFHAYLDDMASARVKDMPDGGMGSIAFITHDEKCLGTTVAEAEYSDIDEVPVSIVVNLDNHGRLFELDIWKADFSPLKRYPVPGLVHLKSD
jgi:hypothetical protein